MDNMSVSSDDSEVESVVNERGVFMLGSRDTELQIVNKLQQLRKENCPTEIDFIVEGIVWTGRIASEMIQTFEHYASSTLQWNEGIFADSDESEPFFGVVETAAKLKLFRQLRFSNIPGLSLTTRLAFALASVFREGGLRGLKGVILCNFEISANAMAVLATGLATTGQTVGLSNLVFIDCPFIGRDESGGLMGAPEYLAAGLASNTTLKKLELSDCLLNDSSLAGIVGTISSHQSLEALLLGSCEYGRNTLQSIHRWLRSDGCRLRELEMDGCYESDDQSESSGESELTLNVVQLFLQDLQQNTSLESLSFRQHSDVKEQDINLLLRSLGKLPSLKSLDISGNELEELASLAVNITNTVPAHRLRSLNLNNTNIFRDDRPMEESTFKFLDDAFPELGYLGSDFEDAITNGILPSSLVLKLDRNRCFGPLQRRAMIPLSVWPLVMAKANKDRVLINEPSRRGTMLYEMLQGPAFGGRGAV